MTTTPVVVTGYGSYAPHGTVQDANYVTARANTRRQACHGLCTRSPDIGVDMSRLAGASSHLVRPNHGKYQRVRGSRFDQRWYS